MNEKLTEMVDEGYVVEMWQDNEASAAERFVVQVYRDGEASAVNYYGRSMRAAVNLAWKETPL